jgi:restriction system protein
MALWLVRAGKHGEYEQKFRDANRIYVCWSGLKHDLSKLATKQDLRKVLQAVYPNSPKGKISNNTGQIWPFAHEMKSGDWVIVPYKTKPAVNIAEIVGPYVFDASATDPYFHYRDVKWIARDVGPLSNVVFDGLNRRRTFGLHRRTPLRRSPRPTATSR